MTKTPDTTCACVQLRFIHLAVCLTTGPKPLPKRALHIVRSWTSSFRCEYPLLSLRSFTSFLRLLPRLHVTFIPPFIFPSITCCRRQFLRIMWPIQVAFRLLISCRIFLCPLTLSNNSFLTRSVQLIFSNFLQHHIRIQYNKSKLLKIFKNINQIQMFCILKNILSFTTDNHLQKLLSSSFEWRYPETVGWCWRYGGLL
jgi:hypothetical protein